MKRFVKKAYSSLMSAAKNSVIFLFGEKGSLFLATISEEIIPIVEQKTSFGIVRFFSLGRSPEHRARELLTKEPETIEWLETFQSDETLWDIGANIGVYSLYAALKNSMKVLAFEPSGINYFLLCKNIELNNLDRSIFPYCIAFNDSQELGIFQVDNTAFGAALNSFVGKQAKEQVGKKSYLQATIGYTVDGFIEQFSPPFPTHIKLDVDGNEPKILRGATKTLRDPRVKSLSMELDSAKEAECAETIEFLQQHGLQFQSKKHSILKKNIKSTTHNYLFRRSLVETPAESSPRFSHA